MILADLMFKREAIGNVIKELNHRKGRLIF